MDELSLRQLNGGDDEDAALRRAMALSIRDSERPITGPAGVAVVGAGLAQGHKRSASTASTASEASSTSSESPMPEPPKQGRDIKQGDASTGASEKERSSDSLATATATAPAPAPAPSSSMSLLALDRRAMEAERLARRQKQLAAQQANDKGRGAPPEQIPARTSQPWKAQSTPQQNSQHLTPPPPQKTAAKRKAEGDVIVIDDDGEDDDSVVQKSYHRKTETRGRGTTPTTGPLQQAPPPAQRRKINHGDDNKGISTGEKPTSACAPASAPAPGPSPSSSLPYAKGVVKKTWARGQPRMGDDVTIDEIWQKDQLELAILSSFQWDDDWMMAHLDMTRTRLLLIAFAADDKQKEEMTANVPSDRIRFCFPRMQAMGSMHSKLQLLKFPGYLRIVVPTGNLTPYDWGETGTVENMVFAIDLPRLPKDGRASAVSTPFREDLCYFLTNQGVDEAMVRSIRNFDYSETARYAFVHTMAGSHTDDAWERTGYAGLGRAVKSLGWDTTKPVQLDYICSSIGSLSDDLTTALYYACQGDSGMKEFESRASRSRRPKAKGQSQLAPTSQSSLADRLRLYFPSQETVSNSKGGVNGAGTICFQRKWWEAPTCPREIFRDAQNVRRGVLLHTKLMLVRRPEDTAEQARSRCRGWAYLGSANMSESAWGRIVKDRATGKIKMSCRSWECGVLIPASPDASVPASSAAEDAYMLDIFRGTLPIPIAVPAGKYDATLNQSERKQPWFFLESLY